MSHLSNLPRAGRVVVRRMAASVAVLALGFGYLSVVAAPAQAADTFTIPDTALSDCVNAAIGGHEGNSYGSYDLYGLTSLTCDGRGIADLTGLNWAPYLAELNVANNQLRSLNGAPLSSIQTLDISNNHIADARPLVGAPGLTSLNAGGQTLAMSIPVNVATAVPVHNTSGLVPALSSASTDLTVDNGEITGTALGDYSVGFSWSDAPTAFSGTITVTVSDSLVSVPDAGFAACLGGQLGTVGSLFSEAAVTGLAELDCSNRGISDLTGAEKLTGATSLDFSGNTLGGSGALTPLAGLTGLQSLVLSNSALTGVSGLTGLTGLTSLNISNNAIADISGLSVLTGLSTLDATGQSLTKLIEADTATAVGVVDRSGATPNFTLPDGVTLADGEITAPAGVFEAIAFQDAGDPITFSGQLRLESHLEVTFTDANLAVCVADALDLSNTTRTFNNLDLLSITALGCSSHTIVSLGGLQYLSGLVDLDLSGNYINDISQISALTNLQSLILSENTFGDISPITSLPNLQNVTLNGVGLASIDAMAGMSTLKNVKLADNALTNIDAVATFPVLVSLDVSGNELSELSAVSGLGSLQTLEASDNLIGSLSPLSTTNSKLTKLFVANNRITSLDGVQNLSRIATLDVSGNRITSLAPLSTRTRLNIVKMSRNDITSLAPLKNLSTLISVEAGDNNITDVSPLAGKFLLSWVLVDHNHIADVSPLSSVAVVDARSQSVTMATVPGVATAVPLRDNASQLPALTLPDGVSVDDGALTAQAESNYAVGFASGDYAGTGKEFSGTLTVESAYHAFTAPTPTITGSAQVGSMLTADAGTWDPTPDELSYRWLADGVEVQRGSSNTYWVSAGDQGAQISVEVTGTSTGFAAKTVTSSLSAPVLAGSLVASTEVVVSGTYAVGETLSVGEGTWMPTPDGITYQWLRDGVSIPLADKASYLLTSEDANKAVSVRVTAAKAGYAAASVRSAATVVALGTMYGDKPVIVGTPSIGTTLQVGTGYWAPSPSSFALQWYRAGYPIDGATGYEYQVTAEDVGKAITVSQTATATGYQDLTKLSNPTSQVPAGTLSGPTSIEVAGTPAVGNTLTAKPGDWTPSPDSFTYQWSRDGSALSDSTSSSYVLTDADSGHEITVRVTAHKAGYASASVDSGASSIAEGTLVGSRPSVTGTPTYGQVLYASSPAWTPVATLSWQWLRDGKAISGATGSSYQLGVDDIGTTVQAQVTASLPGYTSVARSSLDVGPIAAAEFTQTGVVHTSGELAVGKTLSVNPMSWNPTPDQVSYQWLRDGSPITDATRSSYTLTADDLNHHITVNVVATRAGYTEVNLTSEPGDAVAASAFSADAPVISGNAVVGQSLSATSGAWAPMPTTLSYQWLADGNPIGLATSNTYLVTPAVVGKAISVRVTGTRDGYAEKSVESAATAPVAPALMSGPTTATVAGTFTVGQTLSAAAGTWTPAADDVSYQWLRGGQPISGATEADYTVGIDDADKIITVQITLTKAGYRDEVIRSVATDPVARARFDAATPAVEGEAALGQTLTVQVGTWSPTPASTSIQWLRDGVAISGATAGTYALTVADTGKVISVAVSGSAAGYAPHTATSLGTDPVAEGTFTAPSEVTVTGEPTVGKTLSVDPGTWTPAAAEFGYQWLRGGAPIADATKADYTLVAADQDAVITVAVTATRPGYTAASLSSTSATPIGKGTILTQKPTIAGQSKVGATLTAKPGTWSPTPSTWTYQWLRDGSVIEDENGATYEVTASDIGANVSVTVAASLDGYTTTAAVESDPVEVSPQGSFTVPDEITVVGTYSIGETLTAQAGDWTPTPDAVDYQWLRAGKVIPGADQDHYVLAADDLGSVVTVKVTASKDGYRSASSRSQAPVAVAAATFTAASPKIVGSLALGKVLTADPGSWSASPALAYQWLRAGIAVPGATRATYTVGVADVGKRLTVKVTGTKPGYTTVVKVSAATATVQPGALVGPRPVLSGKSKVKSTLKVQIGRWTPSGIKVSYKWYRNGSPIKGATKSAYRLTSKDRGKRIGVRVTYSKAGYVTRTRWVKSSKSVG